jgi:L-ribulose-5-phosphate 3-epimerase
VEATFISDEVSRDLDEAIDFARAEGLSAIELRMIGDANVVDLAASEIEGIRQRLATAGLRVAALATPLFKCPLTGPGDRDDPDPFKARSLDVEDHLARIPAVAAVAEALGTTTVRLFAFLGDGAYEEARGAILAHLRRAGDTFAAVAPGVRLCLENEPTTYLRTAAEVGSAVRDLGPPFHVLWDPGNAYCAGERGPLLGFDAVAGLVGHVHVKDPALVAGEVRFVPIGQGEIDYAEQVDALAASGYDGYVSLEPHLIVGRSSLEGARACLAHLRPLLAAANAARARPAARDTASPRAPSEPSLGRSEDGR